MPGQQDNIQPLSLTQVAATCSAGVIRTILLHPLDTTAKRLQFNEKPITQLSDLKGIILGSVDAEINSSALTKMYKGLNWAIVNRLGQFGMLTIALPTVQHHVEKQLGGKSIKSDLVSSMIMSTGEAYALMLPDAYKIRAQTQHATGTHYRSPFSLQTAGTTIARNYHFYAVNTLLAPVLKHTLMQYEILGTKDQDKPNTKQKVASDTLATLAGVTASTPADVVRTRLLTQPADHKVTAWNIGKSIYKNEGAKAFFKGIGPQIASKGPGYLLFFALEAEFRKQIQEITNQPTDSVKPR